MENQITDKVNLLAIPKDTVNDILNDVKEKHYNTGYLNGYVTGIRKGYFKGFGSGMLFVGSLFVSGLALGAAGAYLIDKIEESLNEEDK